MIFDEKEALGKFRIMHNEDDAVQLEHSNFILARNIERFICDCVRNGDAEYLRKLYSANGLDVLAKLTTFGALGHDELRSTKNYVIVGISLITRAAADGGLPNEIAFPLSDMYILQTEQTTDINALYGLFYTALFNFAERVRGNQLKSNYSKLINQVCGYIIANVNNRLYLLDIANIANVHPDTLSKRFKRETGMLITDYIRRAKTEEAKLLLKYTDKSITEIAYLLAYSSQSQFISVFKRTTGKTPSEFRSQ